MAGISIKVGRIKCRECGDELNVRMNEKGTLSYRCDECGDHSYATVGSDKRANWLKTMGITDPLKAKEDGHQVHDKQTGNGVAEIFGVK